MSITKSLKKKYKTLMIKPQSNTKNDNNKINNTMATINTHLSIVTLNLSSYSSPMKRHRPTEWIKLGEVHLFVVCKKYSLALKIGTALEKKDRQSSPISGHWEARKHAGVTILVSGKGDFKLK